MSDARTDDWLAGGGEMGALIRAHDWSTSRLGPPSSWPQSLKTALSICLGSKFPMVIWWGKDFSVFYNDAYIPITGQLKHPMFLGRPAQEQWPEIWDVVGALANNVISTGNATWSEDQPLFMTRLGFVEEAYFTFSFSPARDESGAVGGMFCAVQEMTGRVIGERRLRILRELGAQEVKSDAEACASAAKVLAKGPNDVPFALIYLTNADKKSATLIGASGLEAGSNAAPTTIDLTAAAAAAWPLARVNESKECERTFGLRALFPGQLPKVPYEEMPDSAYVMPIELPGQESPAGFIVLGINPRLDFNDSYQGFFGLVRKQITSHVFNARALEEEKRRSEALAEIDRAKTAFFSNVSHEFRTPLTLLLGPVEDMLAGGKGALTPAVRAEAEIIHRNALRLLKLVNALLDFSRIEAGRADAVYAPTDLAAATIDLAAAFRSAIERAGMKLIVETEPFRAPVFVDRDMWEKIVLNLLSNAFKYTLQGEIRVSLKRVGETAEFSVADTGTGIPEDELPRVFQRFHRVKNAVGRTHEGTGIGLALVQELVKLHGGSIRAESKPGAGSTFTVSIPLGAAHLPQDRIAGAERKLPSTAIRSEAFIEEALRWLPGESAPAARFDAAPDSAVPPGGSRRKRIVLADDNADMRDYVRKLLESRYEVIAVNDGQKALLAVHRFRPDLVISDVMMPVMDGLQLLKELRQDEAIRTVPVVLLSARAGEEARAGGIETGADDYLTKPFSAKELLARVQTQLYMAGIRQEAAEKDAVVAHLARQQEWLESILDLVPSPLLLMESGTGRMKFANRAAHAMAGGQFPMDIPVGDYGRSYVLTDEQGELIANDDFPGARAARGEKVRDAEVVWQTPAGKFSVLIDSEEVPAIEGQPSRIILCLRDITHMKKIQVELKRLIGARDEFLSVASHELRTPLTSIKLQTQMIKRNVAKGDVAALAPARMEKMVEQTDRQVTRLTHLVDDMLDVSRIETGKLDLRAEPVDLVELVKEVVERLSPQIAQSGSPVTFHGAERMIGHWDRFRIEQVLINLLTNAARYGGGSPIEIEISSRGETAELSIRDHGKGIAPEDQERIFRRFERAISRSEVSGLGLGLYIARQIADAHQGSLRVESSLGRGARFIVALPLS
jgi:signal transduction histidine kinase/DNA-binding NarL/FixJ family response regulator